MPEPGHAFICYASGDADHADRLQQALKAAGIPVWRDVADVWPGEDWRLAIRDAITKDALAFLACFSRAGLALAKSAQNEELLLAIEQLRQRRPQDVWLIPIRFDDCDLPDLDLGAGRTLTSLRCADLFGDRYEIESARLVQAIQRILGIHAHMAESRTAVPDGTGPAADIHLTSSDRQALLQELAFVYRGEVRADTLLDRIGFPRQYRPSLPSGSSILLWSEIFTEFDRGVIRHPYRQLLNAARSEYEGNQVFASLGQRYL